MCAAVWIVPLPAGPILQIAASVLVGGVAYLGTHFLLWLAAGRPEGAEREALGMVLRVLPGGVAWRSES